MKSLACVLCAAIALLSTRQAIAFCFVPQPRLVCAEYFASQLVVESTLAQTTVLHDRDDPEGISAHVYTLTVDKVLRGANAKSLRVYEGNDSGRATFDWVPGKKYLLFLFYLPSEKAWALDGCGNSGPISGAKAALSEISLINSAHDGGFIHGVVSRGAPSTPVAGAHVEAQGNGKVFLSISNAKGEFQLKVPAGQYSVQATAPGLTFSKEDISYENPAKLRIEPGGCAQIQFDGEP